MAQLLEVEHAQGVATYTPEKELMFIVENYRTLTTSFQFCFPYTVIKQTLGRALHQLNQNHTHKSVKLKFMEDFKIAGRKVSGKKNYNFVV